MERKQLEETLRVARIAAVQSRAQPYIAAVAFRLSTIILSKEEAQIVGIPTACVTEGGVLLWNEEDLRERRDSPNSLGATFAHEVWHVLRHHLERGKAMEDQNLASIAIDLEINDDLARVEAFEERAKTAWAMPQKFGLPDGLSAEEYYDLLKERAIKVVIAEAKKSAEGKDVIPLSLLPPEVRQKIEKKARKLSDGELKLLSKKVAQDLLKHERQCGTTPAGLLRWAKAMMKPKVKWTQVLEGELLRRGVGKTNYTWTKRRRHCPPEVALPGIVAYEGDIGAILDTSGSISTSELCQEVTELLGLMRKFEHVIVIACDVKPEVMNVIKQQSLLSEFHLRGGGGTDMREGLSCLKEEFRKRGVMFGVAVVMTDGHTPFPKSVRDYSPEIRDIIWVILHQPDEEPVRVPDGLGRQINVEVRKQTREV